MYWNDARPLNINAAVDLDSDGDLDVVVTQCGREVRLYRNDQQLGNHWLRVAFADGARAGVIGARVELTAGGITQRRQVMPTRSYLSQVELPVTFGLGSQDRVDRLTITWPDGQVQEIPVEAIDRVITVGRGH